MPAMTRMLKRFNVRFDRRLFPKNVLEYERLTYDLCNERMHYNYSGVGTYAIEPQKVVKKIGPCDGSCKEHVWVMLEHLPWEIQTQFHYRMQVPTEYILIHQRLSRRGRPYFKVFGGEEKVSPAIAAQSILLPPGGQTVVTNRYEDSTHIEVVMIRNCSGEVKQEVLATVQQHAIHGTEVRSRLHLPRPSRFE